HTDRPTKPVNPPRRRGKLKMQPRNVDRKCMKKWTHRVIRSRQGHIGRIEAIRNLVYRV
ncbi:hypothetical protein J3R83DRAFT_2706, partial [Lanmaoa asiatica]